MQIYDHLMYCINLNLEADTDSDSKDSNPLGQDGTLDTGAGTIPVETVVVQ